VKRIGKKILRMSKKGRRKQKENGKQKKQVTR
jgi:hypothetical protein